MGLADSNAMPPSSIAKRSASVRRWLAVVSSLAVLPLISCAGERVRSSGPVLTVHIPDQDERALGPLGYNPWFLVLLPLAVGPEGTESNDAALYDGGEPRPRLLDSWEHTSDYAVWTLRVRDGLRWGDGVPVTAEDVKFSLELWTNEKVLYEYPFFDSITVLDERTLTIVFKEPVSATIFTYNWLVIVPKHLLDTLDIATLFSWPYWVQPVGNGPFRYVRHVPGTMTELTVNSDYHGARPRLSTVVLRYGGNPVTELLSGNVDVASSIAPLDAVHLGSDPRFRVYHRVRYQQSTAIAWNHRKDLFRDVRVRRALTMAIDRRELHRLLNHPADVRVFDVPMLQRHHRQGSVPEPLPFAPERAAALLAAAGWIDTDNDGVRERGGREFRFTLSITEDESAQAVYLQDQFRRVGVRMEIGRYDRSALRERVMRGAEFDAAIWSFNYIEQFGTFPVSGYHNPAISALRDSAWFTIDHAGSDRHMHRLWDLFAAEVPITYLHPRVDYFAAHRRVRGLAHDVELFPYVEFLWIDDE